MTLSADQIELGKLDAIDFLEYSIYRTGLALGLLPEEISSSMEIPVNEGDVAYIAYQSLIRQASILEGLLSS